jgi:hypothetical protein
MIGDAGTGDEPGISIASAGESGTADSRPPAR